jgi:hypothetical protein
MKKLALLIATLFMSATCFAQMVSFTDFCYYDSSANTIETHSCQKIMSRLQNRGFSIIDSDSTYDPDYGYYKTYVLYHRSSNIRVYLSSDGPNSITFNSSNDAAAFISLAVEMGYLSWVDGKYRVTRDQMFGVCAVTLSGNSIIFDLYV